MNTTGSQVKRKRIGSKILKVFLVILLMAVVAAGAIYWYLVSHKKAIVRQKVQQAVSKESDGLYAISIRDLQLKEKEGRLSFSGVNIFYDSVRFHQLAAEKKAPKMLLNVKIPHIKITGVKSGSTISLSNLTGNVVEISDPVIDLYYANDAVDTTTTAPDRDQVFREMVSGLNLKFDSVFIRNAKIRTLNLKDRRVKLEMDDITASMIDVKVDKEALADSSRIFFSRSFKMSAGKIRWSSANKLYDFNANQVALLSSPVPALEISEFTVRPVLNEDAFVRSFPTQQDRLDFIFQRILITSVDPEKLLDVNIRGDELIVQSASMKIYRDLNRPRDRKNRLGSYPQQALIRLPFFFKLRKLTMPNAFFEYKERSNITGKAGKVQFYNCSITIKNFTNNRKDIAANNLMVADINTRFLNLANFSSHWVFHMMDPQGRFDVNGNLGSFNATLLNPLLVPMGPARIDDGYINGLQFKLYGNNYGMNGTVQLLYEGLKVTLLETAPGAVESDKKTLSSFLANLLIKNDNPKKKQDIRIANVNYTRDINRSMFNLCWKTLFQGIKQSVGISK